MEENKSPAGQLALIVQETIFDGYELIRQHVPVKKLYVQKDIEYIKKRVDSEGIKFLTVTLPILGEWFDSWFLKEEAVDVPTGFKLAELPWKHLSDETLQSYHPNAASDVPLFLLPFWRFLTDPWYGETETAFQLVRIIRTILLGLKKLEVPETESQRLEKLETFLQIEDDLSVATFDWRDPVVYEAQRLMDDLFSRFVQPQYRSKHGPGAVAGREKGAQKWDFSHYWHSVHKVFPAWDLWPLRSNSREGGQVVSKRLQLAAHASVYRSLVWGDEPAARLLFVPKDSRGPRIISCEPKELMYLQQGLAQAMVSRIENHGLTRGHVNFADQSINANLALEASASKAWSTIDLSDASDRVSSELVTLLFPRELREQLIALRSAYTELPDGRRIRLQKYAPMGSALCFPVESIIFWALCVAAIKLDSGDLSSAREAVYVYGDDIIIKEAYTDLCIEILERFHLRVNRKKSLAGNHGFRESCGMDAFKGHNVTPSRIRKLPPRRPQDGTSLVAYTKYAENSLAFSKRRSQQCAKIAEAIVGPIPRVPVSQSYLHIVDPDHYWDIGKYPNAKWNESRCYYRCELLHLRLKSKTEGLPHWIALQRSLLEKGARDTARVVTDPVTLIRRRVCDITYIAYVGRVNNN